MFPPFLLAASQRRPLVRARVARAFAAVAWALIFVTALQAATLHQISSTVYQTEHCLFIIDTSIPWSTPSAAYAAIYQPSNGSWTNLSNYFSTLTTQFPGTYFSVCYMSATGASNVPNYIDQTFKANGINEPGTQGAAQSFSTVDFCRYNLGTYVSATALAVFDHEIGHAWGAQVFNSLGGPSLANGHWLSNSTVDCQLSATYTADGGVTVNKIYGDPTNGFKWQKVDNLRSNDYEVFSEQELYLMGVADRFPTSYVLNSPSYNADHTMSYSSVNTFDHASLVATYGARSPDYTSSTKRFKIGFVYIARDLAEVNTVYSAVEQSVNQFCTSESIDTNTYRFQVPFLVDARYRASADGLLSDLDGNSTPTLTVSTPYVTSSNGSATVNFTASDPDGGSPSVTLVPGTAGCSVSGSSVLLSGLPDGVFFFTLKATDGGGKKTFAHFVVEVQRPSGGPSITTQPTLQTVTAGNTATFALIASGSPTSYQWYRQVAHTSTWDPLGNGGGYNGANTATLTVSTTASMNEDRFLCLVTNGSGTTTSSSAELRVNETTPVFASQPSDRAAGAGNSTPFSVTLNNTTTFGYYSYTWQRMAAGSGTWTDLSDGGAYSSTTTSSMRVVASSAMNGDQFRCIVTNTTGSTTSNAATLTVGTPPAITVQPSSVSVSAGQSASFSVVASGTSPLSYQWSKYGVPVSGATSATLTINNAQPSDAGAYTVSITNAFGGTGSNAGSLTVTSAAPSISAQPQSTTVTAGQNASFSVTASGSAPLSYQWRKNGSNISGATSSTLSLTNVSATDAATYDVVVTNGQGSATSNGATLTVNPGSSAPSFTTQPASQTLTAGGTINLSAAASGSPTPTYQWQKNSVNIAGATSSSYSIASAQVSDSGNYTVVASNSAGSTTSSTAVVTVNAPAVAPSITAQPQSATITAGNNASFSASATGTAPLSYQWSKGGSVIAGATSSTYSISSAQASDAGAYTVLVSNSAGSVTSNAATLTVTAAPTAPSITTQPQNVTVTTGNSATLSVVASGTAPLTYQWKKGGVDISGATSSSYTITSAASSDGANYTVTITNVAGSVTSSTATVTVTAATVAPSITTDPQSVAITAGNTVNFTVTATGTAPLSYQWKKNGVSISGATQATYSLSNVSVSAAGDYSVTVTNGAGSATSAAATLTVNPALIAPSIDNTPQSASVSQGAAVSFTVTASGSAPLSYQWKKDGVSISGATTATLSIPSAQSSDAGAYTVVVTNAAGSITSSVATLTVSSGPTAPTITTDPSSRGLSLGGSATLSVTASGSSPLSYQWYLNGSPLPNATQSSYSIGSASAADYGDYVVVVSNPYGTAASRAATLAQVSASQSGRLVNLSVRGLAGADAQTLIVGFIVSGNGDLPVLVRGWGPTLGKDPFNVPGSLADPMLRVFRDTTQIAQNDNWGGDAQISAVTTQVGAYAFPAASKDAAVYTTFAGGVGNTVHILGVNTATGVALAEVFDVNPFYTTGSPRFVNLSARGQVGTGGDVLIAGFVIGGSNSVTVLIRALGPALSAFGVNGVLQNPKLELYSGSTVIASNDDWGQAANASQISAMNAQMGLPLPAGSKDAVMLITLPPGAYTAMVSGVNSTTGVALIDLNEVQ